MEELFAIGSLQDLNWGVRVFGIVTITLLFRYVAMRILTVAARHLDKTENVWDDALLESGRRPLSWFILVMGIIWAIELGHGYLQTELFSDENINIIRQLAFIALTMMFLVRFVTLAEERILAKLEARKVVSLGSTRRLYMH